MADFERILRRAEPKTLIDYADLERPMLGPGTAERVAQQFTQSVRDTAETYLESRRDNMKFQVQMAESNRADRTLQLQEEKFTFEKDKINDAFIRESIKEITNFDALGKKTFDEFSGQLSSDTEKNFLKAEWERAKIQDTKLSAIHNELRDKNIKDYTPDDIKKLKQYSEYKTTKFFNVIKSPDLTGKYKRVIDNPNYYSLISIGEENFKELYSWMDWEEFKATDPANWRTSVKEKLADKIAAVAPLTPKEKQDNIIKIADVATKAFVGNVTVSQDSDYSPTVREKARKQAEKAATLVSDTVDRLVPGLGLKLDSGIDTNIEAANKKLEEMQKEIAELEKRKKLFQTKQDEPVETEMTVREQVAVDSLGGNLSLKQKLDKKLNRKLVPEVLTLEQIKTIYNSGELNEKQINAVNDYFSQIKASGQTNIDATSKEYKNLISVIYEDY